MPTRKARALTTNPGGTPDRNNRGSEKADARRTRRATPKKSAKGSGKPVKAETLVEKDRTEPRRKSTRENLRASTPKNTIARRPSTDRAGARPIQASRSGARTGTRTVKGADAKEPQNKKRASARR